MQESVVMRFIRRPGSRHVVRSCLFLAIAVEVSPLHQTSSHLKHDALYQRCVSSALDVIWDATWKVASGAHYVASSPCIGILEEYINKRPPGQLDSPAQKKSPVLKRPECHHHHSSTLHWSSTTLVPCSRYQWRVTFRWQSQSLLCGHDSPVLDFINGNLCQLSTEILVWPFDLVSTLTPPRGQQRPSCRRIHRKHVVNIIRQSHKHFIILKAIGFTASY